MNTQLSKVIGERINTLLASKGNKQKDLAKFLDVKRQIISYFVNGNRIPNTEQIIKISDFFGVTSDYLFGLSNTPSTDKDIQFICKYTGLSETAVETLHNLKAVDVRPMKMINSLISECSELYLQEKADV